MHPIAFLRSMPLSLDRGLRTFVRRDPIDLDLATSQHTGYRRVLERHGVSVRWLPDAPELPDAAFVEDLAVPLDEVTVLARPGAVERRPELEGLEPRLPDGRPVRRIVAPGTLDGGDVLRVGRILFVGASSRTNAAGIEQLARAVGEFGYAVAAVPVEGCLHLKSGCAFVGEGTLLYNPAWIDPTPFGAAHAIPVPGVEPRGANVLWLWHVDVVVSAAEHPETAELLREAGHAVVTTPISEFLKAEAGVTCLCLLAPGTGPG